MAVRLLGYSVAASSTTTVTVTPLDGVQIQANDLLLVVLRSQLQTSNVDYTLPAGWERVGQTFTPTSFYGRVSGYYTHRVTNPASEPSNYEFSLGQNTRHVAIMVVLRGAADVVGYTPSYAGTATPAWVASDGYAHTATPGSLAFMWLTNEVTSPNAHSLITSPDGYAVVAEVTQPITGSTTVSRTYGWLGSQQVDSPGTLPAISAQWAAASGQAAQGLVIAATTDEPASGLSVRIGGGRTGRALITTADGLAVPARLRSIPRGYSSVQDMLSRSAAAGGPGFYWAHRGGSASYPEGSLYAYTQSALAGFGALEVSLGRTSDGVWFACHDQTIDRTSGVSGMPAVSAMTWAEVQAYQITVGATGAPQPYMRWEEVADIYGGSHVLIVDPKYAYNIHLSQFLDLLVAVGAERCVTKYYYTARGLATASAQRGITSWGYMYASDLTNVSWQASAAVWDLLGMEYHASQDVWTQVLALGKPVVAHICPTQAAVEMGRSRGAAGFQCSGTAAITPAR